MKTTLQLSGFWKIYLNHEFKIILTIVLIILATSSKAQSPLDGAVSFIGNEGYFKVVVPDTNNVNEIEIMIGTDNDPSEMFSHTFTYDQNSGLPSGVSYARSGNEISIGMGTVTLLNAYYAKVRLKNTSNSWSDWYEFIGN
jgi:hypothetical protein